MREQTIRRPPLAMLLAMAGAARGAMTRSRTMTPASMATATAVVGGSLYLFVGSAGNFLRHRTTIDLVRVERAQHLVVDGPDRPTRSPMYLGLTGLLLSRTIVRRSPSALIPLVSFVWLIDRHQIPAEERASEERFGQNYFDHKETAPRWLSIPDSSPGDHSREPGAHC